jgi:phospholipase/carboxylesterase
MMALHVGLRRAVPPAAVVAYSGMLIGPQHLADEITTRPPVLLVHGDADPVVPVEALAAARNALDAAGVPCRWHVSPGLGHGIDSIGLQLGGDILTAAFAGEGPVFTASSQA